MQARQRAARNQRNPADSQAIENSGRVPLFFVAAGSARSQKNRISGQIKNVTEVSKELGKIENRGRKFKSSAERWAFRRKFETATEQLKSSNGKIEFVAENLRRPRKMQIAGWRGARLRRRFEFPRENLNFQRIVEGASEELKSSAEE